MPLHEVETETIVDRATDEDRLISLVIFDEAQRNVEIRLMLWSIRPTAPLASGDQNRQGLIVFIVECIKHLWSYQCTETSASSAECFAQAVP